MVRLSVAGGVASLVLQRPEQRNAMSRELVHDLLVTLDRLASDEEVGAIVLSGAGRGFCAGSDLAMLAQMSSAERSAFETDSGRLAQAIVAARSPVVAAVTGFAIGGGLTLAAACDLVVTEPNAKWSLPEAPIGLFPAWGLGLLSERVGVPVARRLAWGLETLSGTEAIRVGLADVLVDDAVQEAGLIAARLAALPRAQCLAVKDFFQRRPQGEEADRLAVTFFTRLAETDEAAATFRKYGKLARSEGEDETTWRPQQHRT